MGSADSPTFNPMTSPELAAAMVAAYDDRYDRTGPLEDPVAPCLAAALRVMVDQVVPDEPDYMRATILDTGWWDKHDLIRSELFAIAAALQEIND
jgi:hypothetical protein